MTAPTELRDDMRDVVVVGGGAVGAAAALELAERGLQVTLIEASGEAPEPQVGGLGSDLRTLALAPASLAWLQSLGGWDERCAQRACSYLGMTVWDAEGTGRIHFDASEAGEPRLGVIVENSVLVAALWQRLLQHEGVDLLLGCSASSLEQREDHVLLGLDGAGHLAQGVLAARLVVGADGARSRVRELAGITTRTWATGQRAVVTVARTERSHRQTAWQRFLPSGPLALLPLLDDGEYGDYGSAGAGREDDEDAQDGDAGGRVSVVWSADEALAESLLGLDDAAFAEALQDATESCLGKVLDVDTRMSFPLQQMHADRYVAHGVALVGDAAHVLHPLAGQGVNLGFKDVRALGEVLGRAVAADHRELITGEALLERYQRQRRADNLAMLAAMGGLKRLFGEDAPAVRLLRNVGLRWFDRAAPLKRLFMSEALGGSL